MTSIGLALSVELWSPEREVSALSSHCLTTRRTGENAAKLPSAPPPRPLVPLGNENLSLGVGQLAREPGIELDPIGALVGQIQPYTEPVEQLFQR